MLYKRPRKLSILWISVAHFRLGWLMLNWYILNSGRFCIVFILCQIITEIHCFWLEYRTKTCSRKKLYRGPSIYGLYIFWLFPCSSKITPRPPLQDSYTAYWLHWYLQDFQAVTHGAYAAITVIYCVLFSSVTVEGSIAVVVGSGVRFGDSLIACFMGPHVGPMIFAIWVCIYWKS